MKRSSTPFGMIWSLSSRLYVFQARMSISLEFPLQKSLHDTNEDCFDVVSLIFMELTELDELLRATQDKNLQHKEIMKHTHDKKTSPREFQVGDLVLLENAKSEDKVKHGKFDSLWLGPYGMAKILTSCISSHKFLWIIIGVSHASSASKALIFVSDETQNFDW